jgi:DNA-directed RNA polymerase
MLVKPTDWTTMENGGYLDQELHQVRLIKGDASLATRLDATDTSKVRSAVNNIQSTGWRINSRVLNVLQILNDAGDGSAGLASSLQPTIPEKPWPVMSKEEWTTWKEIDQNKEEFDKWRYLAKNAYRDQKKWAGHRLVQQQQIMVGEKFVDEAAIYFPHSLDFRGRVYPVAGMGSVNPQGNDAGKALLEFAEGLPLGPDGAKWLAIHLANTYGNDKCSFDDRELWAQMNSDWILECAEDPINNTRWHEADKPLCFLATCFEWQGYHKDGDDHISRTCVAMDGSCSGLQHYGAMLLDEGTCRAVNVIQTGDSPQDVYSVVLNKVTMLVKNNQDPLAMQWVTRLHRNICKQPIMTSVYSVTQRGITLQIETWIGKLVKKGEIEPFVDYTNMQAALFLAPIVLEAIGDELTAATCAMDWLKQVCKIVSATGSALEWQTPVGFTVFQSYRDVKAEVVKITWAGKQQKLNIKTQGKELAPKKCVNAIAANFVHSMDASHLMLVANVAKDHGIDSFGFIHDSFGTHPSNTTLLNEVIRECFIAQYEGDTLADFYEQIREQVEPEVFEQIEPPPRQGNMELQAVRDSLYFFA